MVKWLAARGANILDVWVIRYAVLSGNIELVQWLADRGADILDGYVIRNAVRMVSWSRSKYTIVEVIINEARSCKIVNW